MADDVPARAIRSTPPIESAPRRSWVQHPGLGSTLGAGFSTRCAARNGPDARASGESRAGGYCSLETRTRRAIATARPTSTALPPPPRRHDPARRRDRRGEEGCLRLRIVRGIRRRADSVGCRARLRALIDQGTHSTIRKREDASALVAHTRLCPAVPHSALRHAALPRRDPTGTKRTLFHHLQ